MQIIQHATNLPYIPQYTMWNYAMEHPVLFFMMTCFVVLIMGEVLNSVLKTSIALITNAITTKLK